VWFAGNHSDIGGSYPENESRLSDISLQWMAEIVSKQLPEERRVHIQSDILQCFPSSDGMLHDELMVGVGSHHLHLFVRGDRRVDQGGTLHPTVIERLKMKNVRNFVGFGEYRPTSLQEHPKAKSYYRLPTQIPYPSEAVHGSNIRPGRELARRKANVFFPPKLVATRM
jgi:hypothetical protein